MKDLVLVLLSGFIVLVCVATFLFSRKRKLNNILRRHIVVTGGSKGIGLCIAIECAKKGAYVSIYARDVKQLENALSLLETHRQFPEQKFRACSLDISIGYEEVEEALLKSENDLGCIYMLINSAGFAVCGVFEDISVEDSRKLMDVNYFGAYYCTRYVLPKMKSAGEGIIVFIASQAALLGIYGYGSYAASKYALRAMAETIAMESKSYGVSVTLALPADTDTPGFENEEKTKPLETKKISGSAGLARADDVAKQILDNALNGDFISVMGLESWFLTLVGGGLFPWKGFIQNIIHSVIIGPLRLSVYILHLHFEYIIKNCKSVKS